MKAPIGILDSGIGGLSVIKEIIQLLPHESIVYIGDSSHTPYGNKSQSYIFEHAKKMITFLLSHEAKIIVIACNTITVSVIDQLRETFPNLPLIGTVPVIKKAVEVTKNKRIGILSTTYTSRSEYQKKLIGSFGDGCYVLSRGTDALVPLIEAGKIDTTHLGTLLHQIVEPFKTANIDTLALGCTHFPLISENIKKELGNDVILLDSGAAIARQVNRVLEHNHIENKTAERTASFYTTGDKAIMISYVQKYIKTPDWSVQTIQL